MLALVHLGRSQRGRPRGTDWVARREFGGAGMTVLSTRFDWRTQLGAAPALWQTQARDWLRALDSRTG